MPKHRIIFKFKVHSLIVLTSTIKIKFKSNLVPTYGWNLKNEKFKGEFLSKSELN